jgi:integrase
MKRVAQDIKQGAEQGRRRTSTAGQIIPRGEDTWLVRVFMGRDREGNRRYLNKTIKGKKKDAQNYLSKTLTAISTGTFVEPSLLTVSEYLDKWLASAARPRVSQRTADGYEGLLKRNIRVPIGQMRLDSLQPLDIQKVYGELQARGLGARSIRHIHAALHTALKQAVKWGMVTRNPSDFVELPKVPHTERRVLTPDEAVQFLQSAAVMQNGLIFEFALLSGMRPEEYLALQWADINFERGTATVRRALVRHKKSWSFQEPKTARSRRTVSLPSTLIQKLAKHRRSQAEQRLKVGNLWQANQLVFCSGTGTPLSVPNLTYRYFHPILEAAKLPRIRLYDLRHSCATLLLIAEENPKVVSERLGHSTVVLTLDTYSHVLPTMQQQAATKLEGMLYRNEIRSVEQK